MGSSYTATVDQKQSINSAGRRQCHFKQLKMALSSTSIVFEPLLQCSWIPFQEWDLGYEIKIDFLAGFWDGWQLCKGQVCPASSEPVCYIHTYMGLARKLMNILVYEIMNQISQPKLDTPSMAYVHSNTWCSQGLKI